MLSHQLRSKQPGSKQILPCLILYRHVVCFLVFETNVFITTWGYYCLACCQLFECVTKSFEDEAVCARLRWSSPLQNLKAEKPAWMWLFKGAVLKLLKKTAHNYSGKIIIKQHNKYCARTESNKWMKKWCCSMDERLVFTPCCWAAERFLSDVDSHGSLCICFTAKKHLPQTEQLKGFSAVWTFMHWPVHFFFHFEHIFLALPSDVSL